MRWCRTDPVQEIGALLVTGPAAGAQLADAMARKSALFQALTVEHGTDWAAIFAAPLPGEADAVLPRLAGATPLYRAAGRWWFPVGTRLDVPCQAEDALLAALADFHEIRPPAILVPRLAGDGDACEADVYLIRDPIPFRESGLAVAGDGR